MSIGELFRPAASPGIWGYFDSIEGNIRRGGLCEWECVQVYNPLSMPCTTTYSDVRNEVDKGPHCCRLESLEKLQCIVLLLPPCQLWIQNIEDESTLSG